MKKTREFHDNESENISGESIGVAALVRGRRLLPCFVPDVALIRGRHLIEGGAYSSKYGNFKPIPSATIADKTFDYQNENKV